MSKAVLEVLEHSRLVPVLRAPSPDLALIAADALVAGGIRVIEVTLTVPKAVDVIRTLVERFASTDTVVGAGTVLNGDEAAQCLDAGAQFVVTPGLDVSLVEKLKEQRVPVMPGALTPTEVITAWQAGADMVKVFPCSAMGGPGYLKSLKAPLPDVKLFPTGGVKLENINDYLNAGASVLGVGAALVDINAVSSGEPERLTERARAYVSAIDAYRDQATQ
ncbi:MAG: bifunctional 4-hydroxy-2-oxoglutarate aldolase/2-dehydro-3-deoxy-phosphogluconate aldolase [Myxococcota bacterium]